MTPPTPLVCPPTESMQHWKQPMVRLALVHQLTVLEQPARCHMVHHLTEDMHLTHHLVMAIQPAEKRPAHCTTGEN